MRGDNLSDEPQLGGRDSAQHEDEEQGVVAGMWSSHLQRGGDTVIGCCHLIPYGFKEIFAPECAQISVALSKTAYIYMSNQDPYPQCTAVYN